MKRLFLALLLFALPVFGQDLRPSAYVGKPKTVTVRGGKVMGSTGGVVTLAQQDINPAASSTTYIYVDLSSTPVIATSTSGFPASSYFPICTVITDVNGVITSFTDSRPDAFMAGGSGGGNGVGNGAGPVIGLYLSSNCPATDPDAACYLTPANTQKAVDCGWSGTTVTCATAHFTTADTGKLGYGWNTCQAYVSQANMSVNGITNTINAPPTITFVSPTSVSLSTTVFAAQSGTASCFIWGNPDDAAATVLDTAMTTMTASCPIIHLTQAGYMFTKPHFFNQPPACANLTDIWPASGTFGDIYYSGGLEVQGRGPGATTIYLPPNFPNGDPCNHGGGSNGASCFFIPTMGRWSNFSLDGGSNVNAGNLTNKFLLAMNVGTLEYFNCYNFGAFAPSLIGIYINVQSQLYQVDNNGCGGIGIAAGVSSSASGAAIGIRVAVENSQVYDLEVFPPSFGQEWYTFFCRDCQFAMTNVGGAGTSGQNIGIASSGGSFECDECTISNNNITSNARGFDCIATGCNTVWRDSRIIQNAGGGNNTGIRCEVGSVCTNTLQNTLIASGSSVAYTDGNAASKMYDLGANNITGTITLTGQWFGEANSANLAAATATNLVLSAGWGNGPATVTALTGGDFPVQFTVTNTGVGQGASPTITYTFPTPLPVAPFSCTATQVGGTNAIGTFTTSALTKTGATFTFSLTPTAAATEIVNVNCVTP